MKGSFSPRSISLARARTHTYTHMPPRTQTTTRLTKTLIFLYVLVSVLPPTVPVNLLSPPSSPSHSSPPHLPQPSTLFRWFVSLSSPPAPPSSLSPFVHPLYPPLPFAVAGGRRVLARGGPSAVAAAIAHQPRRAWPPRASATLYPSPSPRTHAFPPSLRASLPASLSLPVYSLPRQPRCAWGASSGMSW